MDLGGRDREGETRREGLGGRDSDRLGGREGLGEGLGGRDWERGIKKSKERRDKEI